MSSVRDAKASLLQQSTPQPAGIQCTHEILHNSTTVFKFSFRICQQAPAVFVRETWMTCCTTTQSIHQCTNVADVQSLEVYLLEHINVECCSSRTREWHHKFFVNSHAWEEIPLIQDRTLANGSRPTRTSVILHHLLHHKSSTLAPFLKMHGRNNILT
jgi:hypothetical protein